MVEAAGGFLAWLGASLLVLSDGRRALAFGAFLGAAGLALVSFSTGGWLAAAALAIGGLFAAAGRLMTGQPGWSIMPPGSTPRLVLSVAGGLVGLWVGLAVMSGEDGGLRFAVTVMIGLTAARVLGSDDTPTVLTAAGMLALALAAASGLGATGPNLATYLAAAAVAAATSFTPTRRPRAA